MTPFSHVCAATYSAELTQATADIAATANVFTSENVVIL